MLGIGDGCRRGGGGGGSVFVCGHDGVVEFLLLCSMCEEVANEMIILCRLSWAHRLILIRIVVHDQRSDDTIIHMARGDK